MPRPRERPIAFAVFAVSLAVFTLCRLRLVPPGAEGPGAARLLTGDEPAYLLLTHSLVADGDFNLFNNRVNRDGRFFGVERCDEHGARKDWEKREIYSIHTPGLAILLAPAYAMALRTGIPPRAAVLAFMNLLAALLAANLYLLCRALRGGEGVGSPVPALAATAAVVFTPPVLFYANLVYPEMPAALIVLYAFRRSLRSDPDSLDSSLPVRAGGIHGPGPTRGSALTRSVVLPAIALAFLPWLSFRFFPASFLLLLFLLLSLCRGRRGPLPDMAGGVDVGVGNGSAAHRPPSLAREPRRFRLFGIWEARVPRVAAGGFGILTIIPLVLSLALFFRYQYLAFGSLNPSAGYVYQNFAERGFTSRGILDGPLGLVLDGGHGILTWSPVYLLALTGLLMLIRERPAAGLGLAALLAAIYLPGANFVFWWGGFAPPPRYMVVPAPLLGGALAAALSRRPGRAFTAAFGLLLAASLIFGAVGSVRPNLLYKHRHPLAPRCPRLFSAVFPSFFKPGPSTAPLAVAWGGAVLCANGCFFLLWNRRRRRRGMDTGVMQQLR